MEQIIRQKLADSLELVIPDLIPRSSIYVPEIPNKAKAIVGMRRTGKTSYLFQKISEFLVAGTPRECLVYFSFEDERLADLGVQDLNLIIENYYRRFPEFRGKQEVTFFFDEIQLVDGWEQFVRRILDSEKVCIYLSGSSSKLLSREVATSMRGRAVEAIVYPFSFQETLQFAEKPIPLDPANLSSRQHNFLEKHLVEYLNIGGFPEAQGLAPRNHRHLLQGYVDIVLLRDIAERHQLTNLQAIRWLTRQLLANPGGPFSANRFHRDLQSQQIRSSVNGLLEIFSHLEDAFLVHGVPIEAGSERKRQVNPVKTYPIDPGLIHVFDRTGRGNLGHALENIILIELLRRGADVTWVRTPKGYEVDFLARYPDGQSDLIQVAADIQSPQTYEREIRALQDASPVHKDAKPYLITLYRHPIEPSSDPMEITILPAHEWLLSNV